MPAPTPIATVLTTGGDDAVLAYLRAAREHHTQAKIAKETLNNATNLRSEAINRVRDRGTG